MKKCILKTIIIISTVLMTLAGCDLPVDYPSVAGKKYVGEPIEINPEFPDHPCMDEGYGQRGYHEFSSEDDTVYFIWPGSDIMDSGTYVQTELEVKINSMYGEVYYFTVSEDGIEIYDNKYGTVYRDENFPWE